MQAVAECSVSVDLSESELLQELRENMLVYGAAVFAGYRPAAHHRYLGYKLNQVRLGKVKRLIINVPPQFGKSKTASEIFPAHYLGHFPTHPVMSFCCTQGLANKFGKSVRDFIRTPVHAGVFPDSELDPSTRAKAMFGLTAGGEYNGMGLNSTGVGKPARLLIMDDLIKNRKDAQSAAGRVHREEMFTSVIRPRLHPDAAMIKVSTRWAKNDDTAFLLKECAHENWEVVSIPAIARKGDVLGRRVGQHLWPERYSLRDILTLQKSVGPREFDAQYQQIPSFDEDVYFSSESFKYYSKPYTVDQLYIIQSWDLTFGTAERAKNKKASWVVGQVWGIHRKTGRKLLLFQVRGQWGFRTTCEQIRKLSQLYPSTQAIYVEKKANGNATGEVLTDEFPLLELVDFGTRSKEDRAIGCEPACARGEIWLPDQQYHPWVRPLMFEIDSFPTGDTDDCIDALSQAILVMTTDTGYRVTKPLSS